MEGKHTAEKFAKFCEQYKEEREQAERDAAERRKKLLDEVKNGPQVN